MPISSRCRFDRFWPTLAVLTAVALSSTETRAQIPPELPMSSRTGVGVRALGMGGAYGALSHDLAGLHYNAAGLAGTRRGEFSLSFERRNVDSETEYLGNRESTSFDKTRLHSAGFVYPFPTVQGSLVLAAAYQQTAPFDLEYLRIGSGGEIESEEEFISEQGSARAYRVGLGWDVAPNLSLGLTGALFGGDSSRSRDFFYTGSNGDSEDTVTDIESDLHGFTGSFGAQYRAENDVTLGLSVNFPESYTLEGRFKDDVIRYEQIPGDTLFYVDDYIDEFDFKDKITMPWRFTGSAAYEKREFALTADVTFTDWTDIDYDGPIKVGRDFAYRSTFDFRIGAEYHPFRQPWSLRGGYAYVPLAYDVIATDVFFGDTEQADFARENQFFSLGAGVILDRSLFLDAAYLFGGYERSGRSLLGETVEKQDEQKLLLSVTYRSS